VREESDRHWKPRRWEKHFFPGAEPCFRFAYYLFGPAELEQRPHYCFQGGVPAAAGTSLGTGGLDHRWELSANVGGANPAVRYGVLFRFPRGSLPGGRALPVWQISTGYP